MNFEALVRVAREDRLYPSLILYGKDAPARQDAAIELARVLLCERSPEERPCGECRHCRRIAWPDPESETFHPDFHVLERDLRTATSAAATRTFLQAAYSSPYEGRGQVFVVAEAETLTGEAGDSLLKILEEPPERSPRHFMLLAASRLDLLTTLRSRSLSVFLGAREELEEETVDALSREFAAAVARFQESRSAVYLLTAAGVLEGSGDFKDPRGRRPWALAAAAVVRSLEITDLEPDLRRRLLAFAQALLDAPRMRVRAVQPGRIFEGLLSLHLAGDARLPSFML